ncbi:MAG: DUF2760 domain-containing protein [Polyangiales bacterium]
MPNQDPAFFARILLAFLAFFRVLFNGAYAGQVQRLSSGEPTPAAPVPPPAPAPPPPAPEPPKLRELPTASALQLLGLLQREGRLIDFLQEDVSGYSDAEVGAAARVMHGSVKKALLAHVALEPVRSESEGTRVTVPAGFSAQEVRLVGNVVGQPPFSGTLTHAGWRAARVELPQLSTDHDVKVIAPAEVEL